MTRFRTKDIHHHYLNHVNHAKKKRVKFKVDLIPDKVMPSAV